MFELSGTIKEIFDEQTFKSGFNKREFVVTTEDKYPQDIKFGCVKDKTTLLDGFAAGDRVKVNFDVRGREWKGNHFVDLNAWKIQKADAAAGGSGQDRVDEPMGDDEPPF